MARVVAAVRDGLADVVDFISLHHYQKIDRYGADGVEEMREYMVSRGMPACFSEWNLDGQDIRTGLFTAGFLNMLERTPECPIAEAALMLRHSSASGWNNAFVNFDRRGWYFAPNGVVFSLWSECRLPRRVAVSGDCGGLDVVACASDDGSRITVKIVNTVGAEVPLRLALPDGCILRRVRTVCAQALSARNTMEKPDAVAVREHPFSASSLEVPPYSATVVEALRTSCD